MIKVLIVDDSALMRRMLGSVFKNLVDYEVAFAGDGVEALARLHEFQPHVIMLDVQMPLMDGLACLDRIMVERPCPVIMVSSLTAHGAEETLEAIELARRGYVTLVADALCFNERQDSTGKLKDDDYERYEAMYRITEGKTLQGKYVWDARRGLDYLETRPEVDTTRIGMIGHSLGGQETLFTTAIDIRTT